MSDAEKRARATMIKLPECTHWANCPECTDHDTLQEQRIKELERQVTDERSRGMLWRDLAGEKELQAAAMRKVLEEKLVRPVHIENDPTYWACKSCGGRTLSKFSGDIRHTPDCPLSSEAGKPTLAVLEAVEDVDADLRPVLNNPEFERAGNVVAMRLQPLLKLHEAFAALKEVK